MKKLEMSKMEVINGEGSLACAATIIGGQAAIWGLGVSIASGGVAPFGIALSIVGLAATLVGGAGTCSSR
jgi:hypothetical protein